MKMTERLLQKLLALDEYSGKMMDMQTLKCQMQNISVKKSLHIPLTCDFNTGFEKPFPKTTASKIKESYQKEQFLMDGQKMEDKFTRDLDIQKPEHQTSELLPRKHLLGKANIRSYSVPGNLKYAPLDHLQKASTKKDSFKTLLYPKGKDKPEKGHMMPWVKIYHPAPFKGPALDITEFSDSFSYGKKEKTQGDFPGKDKNIYQKPGTGLPKDRKKARKNPMVQKDFTPLKRTVWLSNRPDLEDKSTNLIPLSIEDELNKPNAKIINLNQSKQVASSLVTSSTNPIIFHDMRYIQMFLLTRKKHYLKNKEKPINEKTNLVLKKNSDIIKNLIRDPVTATFCPKGTLLDEWQIDANMIPLEAENVIKEAAQRKSDFPSVQVADDDFLAHKDRLESDKSSKDLTSKPSSQFKYSSNARHSKYLQNFHRIHNTVRMTHLDNLLNKRPPKLLGSKTAIGTQDLKNKPQTSSLVKYNEKFSGSGFESNTPVMEIAEQMQKEKAQERQAFISENPLFLTSLDDADNWTGGKSVVPKLSWQPFINISTAQ
ncbi:uncharacterized protein C1orf141 homolog [Macrotis lagotis]|uniref:uncharacterized protein C1orf141 homolog n=1 Tax=Macrotis lagotis TaxID=92651 RepID=UPI003D697D8F